MEIKWNVGSLKNLCVCVFYLDHVSTQEKLLLTVAFILKMKKERKEIKRKLQEPKKYYFVF